MKIVLNILVAAAALFLYPEAEARFSGKSGVTMSPDPVLMSGFVRCWAEWKKLFRTNKEKYGCRRSFPKQMENRAGISALAG